MKVYDGSQWIEASAAQQASLVTFEYVATASQTTFSGADANGVVLSYTVGNVLVAVNGVRMRPGDDFTASNGTSVVLLVAAAAGDEILVDAFKTFEVANTYTQAQVDAEFLRKAGEDGVTVTGGNMGIGTSSPAYKVDAVTAALGNTAGNQQYLYRGTTYTGNTDAYEVLYDRTSSASGWTAADLVIRRNVDGSAGQSQIRFGSGNFTSFWTNSAERARIASGGEFLVGTTDTSSLTNSNSINMNPAGSGGMNINHVTGTASSVIYARFGYAAGVIGSITQNGTTAVAYNTTSDYRLKENVQPLAGALSRIAALKPCTYTWKNAPDETGEGFIAHELAEVCPQAVTGEKDAVNEDGSINPQSIDTSFLVATLTAAIQEQQAIITALTARVEALETK
jgi:hypothetical protein